MQAKSTLLVRNSTKWIAILSAVTIGLTVSAFAQGTTDGDRQLLKAAEAGDVAAVKKLLADGAHVSARASDGAAVLSVAAQNGRSEVAAILIDNGADLNAQRTDGATAAFLAAKNGQAGDVETAFEQGRAG